MTNRRFMRASPKDPAMTEREPQGRPRSWFIRVIQVRSVQASHFPFGECREALITAMFFDPRRYDLAKVGRYKFNKKLALRRESVQRTGSCRRCIRSCLQVKVIAEGRNHCDKRTCRPDSERCCSICMDSDRN